MGRNGIFDRRPAVLIRPWLHRWLERRLHRGFDADVVFDRAQAGISFLPADIGTFG